MTTREATEERGTHVGAADGREAAPGPRCDPFADTMELTVGELQELLAAGRS